MANKEFHDVQLDVNFTQASSRANIVSEENISVSFGKLNKWYEGLVPTGGSSGQFLGWNSSGTAKWVSSPNTDSKVKQTHSTDTKYKPLLIGYAGSSTAGFTPSEVTDQAYVNKSIYVQPSTGTLYATDYIGKINGFTLSGTSGSTYNLNNFITSEYISSITSSGNGNAVTVLGVNNGVLTYTLGKTFSEDTHTHGLLHSNLKQAAVDTTTDAWSTIGIDPSTNGYILKSIRYSASVPPWGYQHGSGIAFGGADTRGVINIAYGAPGVTFVGGNQNSTTKTAPTWYFKLIGTTATQYNLDNFWTQHGTIPTSADTTSTVSPAHGGTFTVVDSVTRDSNGHVKTLNTKTVTLPSIGSHTHSANDITAGYLNIHPENSPVIIPFMNNDIAFLPKRGGTYSISYDGTTQSINIDGCFDGTPSYGYGIGNSSDYTEIVIVLNLFKTFTWTNSIYCDFGSAGWRAKNVKVEVINTNYASDVWTQKYSNTNLGKGHFYVTMTHIPVGADNAGGGFNKIRFTFSSFNSNIFRIAQLGIYNYGSLGLSETFVSKGGAALYGTLYPNTTNGADLGTSSKYWNNLYITNINGVAVGSSPKFTDYRVTQSSSTTANYRPLVLGATNSTTVSDLDATTTNQTYVTTNMYVQPSTGSIFANYYCMLTTTADTSLFSSTSHLMFANSSANDKFIRRIGMSNAADLLIPSISTSGTSTPTDNDYYISQWAGGSSANPVDTRPVKRTHAALWAYIKSKTDAIYLPLTGGTLTGRVTTSKFLNYLVKGGTGTAGGDKGSSANPRYVPSIWTFNTGQTATDGDIIMFKIPVAGHDYGVYLSIDNGTNYYPVVVTGNGRLTTHYGNGNYIAVIFRSDGSAASMIPRAGNNDGARVTVSGGVWQCIDYYDSGNTYDRTSIQTRIYAGGVGVFRYSLCAMNNNQRMESFTTTGDANGSPTTTKQFNTTAKFMYPPVIMYQSQNAAYTDGQVIGNNYLYEQFPNIDARYSCNITTSAGFTQYKPVYLECNLNSDNTFSITANGLTQTFTSGKYYILLGCMYSTSVYQLALFAQHPMFYYDGTNLNGVIFSAAEKTKLIGIEAEANKYVHPSGFTVKSTAGFYKYTVNTNGHVTAGDALAKADITALGIPGQDTKYGISGAYGSSNTTWVSTLTAGGTGTSSTVPSMVGADGTNAGKAGLVTKPTATDNTKFLRGDGTWATPATGDDTKVTQTPTNDSNTSYRPVILGMDYTNTPTSYTGEEKTDTTYAACKVLIKPSRGDMYVNGTLTLANTNDASGSSDNGPALIVGGTMSTAHIEIDNNEILAKSNATTLTSLYLNESSGGNVYINDKLAAKTTGTNVSGQIMIADGTDGSIKSSGYTIQTSVPSGAVFTDTKNTAGSTDTSSKIYLIGATSQAANPQTYSDDQCYVTNGTLQSNIVSATAGINANSSNSGTAGGISLYSTNPDQYGIIFRHATQKGKHGYVQGDWATYFTMNPNATTRGWIFALNQTDGNVASVSGAGNAVFNGSVTVGGNSSNTSGCRMEYNTTTQSLDFVFS